MPRGDLTKGTSLRTLLMFILVCIACQSSANANDVNIFLIITKPPDPAAYSQLLSWSQMFGNNLRNLTAGVSNDTQTSGVSDLPKIKIKQQEVARVVDSDALQAWWNSASALEAVSAIAVQKNEITIADDDIFVGNLKGSLTSSFLHVRQEIVPSEYQVSHDQLAIITLYTYAMDVAKTLPTSAGLSPICRPLDKANQYASTLAAPARTQLDLLLQAIKAELDLHHCGAKR